MPRLTEILCTKPVKKFTNYKYRSIDKLYWPMTLRDHVSSRGDRVRESVCLPEMSTMLECLKKHDYNESPCKEEVDSFYQCWNTFKTNFQKRVEAEKKGIFLNERGRMNSKQVNKLLAKNPHPKS